MAQYILSGLLVILGLTLSCGDLEEAIKGEKDSDEQAAVYEPDLSLEEVDGFLFGPSDFTTIGSPPELAESEFKKDLSLNSTIFHNRPESLDDEVDACVEQKVDELAKLELSKTSLKYSVSIFIEDCVSAEDLEEWEAIKYSVAAYGEVNCLEGEFKDFEGKKQSQLSDVILASDCTKYDLAQHLKFVIKGRLKDHQDVGFELVRTFKDYTGKSVNEACELTKPDGKYFDDSCVTESVTSEEYNLDSGEQATVVGGIEEFKASELESNANNTSPYYNAGKYTGRVNNWNFELVYSGADIAPSLTATNTEGKEIQVEKLEPLEETELRLLSPSSIAKKLSVLR